MKLRARDTGREFDTQDLAVELDPIGCAVCGNRVGWWDTAFSDKPAVVCDHCAPDYRLGEDGEPVKGGEA